MLWFSGDDGDPPRWMWLLMLCLAVSSIYYVLRASGSMDSDRTLYQISKIILVLSLYWFSTRAWSWFDKS